MREMKTYSKQIRRTVGKKKKKINLRRAASELGNWYVVGQVLASSSRKSENGRREENGDRILDASYGTQVHIGKN